MTKDLSAILWADIIDASHVSDIDTAILPIQDKAGIEDGGVAAMAFSGFDWRMATIRDRRDAIIRWLKLEESYTE